MLLALDVDKLSAMLHAALDDHEPTPVRELLVAFATETGFRFSDRGGVPFVGDADISPRGDWPPPSLHSLQNKEKNDLSPCGGDVTK